MTILRIVDPTTEEVGLSFSFEPKTGSALVINGYHGSSVANVTEYDGELFLYFVQVDDFQAATAPVVADDPDAEPRKLVAPVL